MHFNSSMVPMRRQIYNMNLKCLKVHIRKHREIVSSMLPFYSSENGGDGFWFHYL